MKNQCYNGHNGKWVVRENGKIIGNFDKQQEGIPVSGDTPAEDIENDEPILETDQEKDPEKDQSTKKNSWLVDW